MPEFRAVETLIKGGELPLPDGHFFHDQKRIPHGAERPFCVPILPLFQLTFSEKHDLSCCLRGVSARLESLENFCEPERICDQNDNGVEAEPAHPVLAASPSCHVGGDTHNDARADASSGDVDERAEPYAEGETYKQATAVGDGQFVGCGCVVVRHTM